MRNSFGIMAMMIINPVLILFYQNCSMVPTTASTKREVAALASQSAPAPAPHDIQCARPNEKGACPLSLSAE